MALGRIQCGEGHYFDAALDACDHVEGGEVCGWRPDGSEDNQAKIRALLAGEDPVLATSAPDLDEEVEIDHRPGAAAEAKARLREARERTGKDWS